MLINPQGGDFDLCVTARAEINLHGGGVLLTVDGKTSSTRADSLREYLKSELDSRGRLTNLASSFNLWSRSEKTDDYMLSEYSLLAGQPCDVTGTCMENPKPRDEHDRNMIAKGRNEPTFVISYRSEKEIERQLRKRAITYIFAGAPLATVCLGLLLWKLELL